MNKKQWKIFEDFREDFRNQVEIWKKQAPELPDLQKKAVELAKAPLYPFETSVVYNKSLDEITENDEIKLIVIGDNPGKDEQLLKNNKYLVGQAGKIADGYFKKNPELAVDFRKNVIILNKTPVHSGKTAQLKTIVKLGGEKIASLVEESQIWMANRTGKFHCDLCNCAEPGEFVPELWLVGYGELKNKGIFIKYRDVLKKSYIDFENGMFWNKVFVFQHFSMNRFTIDLNNFSFNDDLPLIEKIHSLGNVHKDEIFGQGLVN